MPHEGDDRRSHRGRKGEVSQPIEKGSKLPGGIFT